MIRLTKVSKQFKNGTWGLMDISMSIPQGEFIYIVGPSGAGKSTLFKLLLKEEESSTGAIQIGNVLLSQVKERQLYMIRRQVGVIGQEDLLLPYLTSAQNVDYALRVLGLSRKIRQEKTTKALALVGMLPYKDRLPEELSAGQRKKIAIARAIVTDPAVLIADEPTGNLDVKSAVEIMKLFLRINQLGTTVLLATHDSTMVNSVRNRVLEFNNGRLVRDEQQGGYTKYADPKDTYVW
jgi:cell division transport system ATP-binding protein